jgi:iron(III) transport system permease protein
VGRSLTSPFRRLQQPLTLSLASLILLACCFVPLLALLAQVADGGWDSFGVWLKPNAWRLLLRSLVMSSVTTLLALIIGTMMGVLIARCAIPGRRALWLIHLFPAFLPPFLLALGWFDAFQGTGVLEALRPLLYSSVGVVLILSLAFAPLATSLVVFALLGIDAVREESGRIFGRPYQVIVGVLLPAIRPTLVLAALIVFALAFSEIGVPMFLRVDVFPAAVFSHLGGMAYAPGEAFALALPVMVIVFAMLAIERKFSGARAFAVGGIRGLSRSPIELGASRARWIGAAWLIALFGLCPIAGLVMVAANGTLADSFSWAGYTAWRSLGFAVVGATLIASTGLVIGHALARKLPTAKTADSIALLTFLMPAPVIGAGLLAAASATGGALVVGTSLLIVALVARYLAIGVRAAAAVMSQSSIAMEESAAAAGAGYWQRMLSVVLPANLAGVLAVWLFAFIFCLRDFESAVLVYPPGGEPLTVRIFTLEANGPPAVVSGLALLQVAITAVAAALGLVAVMRAARR